MAKIITSQNCKRRTIRLSSDDVISIVQQYQQLTLNKSQIYDIKDILGNCVFYLPEDI